MEEILRVGGITWICIRVTTDHHARTGADRVDSSTTTAVFEFCTGCPRLPVGGIGGIGKITVVRRGENNGGFELDEESARQSLPTVNTCFKYLKLPLTIQWKQ